jgi:glycosyltransferase involved in cell wall biosynthesis
MRGLPLAKALRNRFGWEVEVLTAIPWYPIGRFYDGYESKVYQTETVDGIPVHRVWLYPSHDRSAMRRIATYFSFMFSALCFAAWRIKRGDIVYHVDNLPTTAIVAGTLGFFWRAKVVQHIGDLWPDTVFSSGMLGRAGPVRFVAFVLRSVMRLVYASNDKITVISEGFRQALVGRGVPPGKVLVLPNWADEDRLSPVVGDGATRRRLGVGDGEFLVLYAGNIGPLQCLDVVVDAASNLRGLPVKFVVVGDGACKVALERAVATRGLSERVLFFPPRRVDDMPALNAVADALLVHLKDEPFLHDTVPSKTQVSLLAGRPILMGCKGEAARHVQAARAGLCFDPESGDQLAEAVGALFSLSVEEREEMGRRGREYYYRHLSLAKGSQKMDDLFRSLIDVKA